MSEAKIYSATLEDLEVIHRIGRQTFLEAFAKDNTEDDINQYVDRAFAKEQLEKELSNSESQFFMARLAKEVIGYLKINHGEAQTEKHDRQAIEIERIYVLEAYYGKRVGKLLFNKAFEIAQLRKATCLWLGVWEKNIRAIRFYHKLGFIAFDKHSFMLGTDLQTDILMRLEITPHSSIVKND